MPSPSASNAPGVAPGPRCPRCGKVPAADGIHSYRRAALREIHYRCECGKEWLERYGDVDRGERVSADELLTVHERLQAWEGSLLELLEVRPDV